ncbi:hypothetical protein ASD79_11755 [Caulobacter sp. Root655]|uniref:hypothetical protein n=1 Tax=Caulobacter sp. Root655 TaxID=1736578 RepID=UPI0006FF09C1|nr:hypothetical protein [Caulobacter sp. Root655]KRA59355.1 hypothetical protein ASD79_11755 [Caulobacter sp. Root655]
MAYRHDMHPQHIGLVGLALLIVLLFVGALVWGSWRSGLLAVRPDDFAMRLPAAPTLPRAPTPNPQPAPLPKPGPGVER